MSLEQLAAVIASGMPAGTGREELARQTEEAIKGLFGSRYQARSSYGHRVSLMPGEDSVSFAGLLHEESPTSGVYGGMSLIWFPIVEDGDSKAGSLLTFVCGTRGLSPDEEILGRPGHARYLQALRRHLGQTCGVSVWTKYDPTSLSQPFPKVVRQQYPEFSGVINRYGNYIYACVRVPQDADAARGVVAAFLDLYAWERGWQPLAAAKDEVEALKVNLRANLFPKSAASEVNELLRERRFLILQGPPGTGKTRMAGEILRDYFQGAGMTVQFHPAVTYETFVAGITPAVEASNLKFDIKPGWLLEAVRAAGQREYLLVIDEINRADLGRVLGEAIHLFEPREIAAGRGRSVQLPHPLADGTRTLEIPSNLYVLGTMNTADRSIAILDLAVRRRFAFVDIWPDMEIVAAQGIQLATEAFGRLQDIFAQYAPPDALVLLPGHAYFLAETEPELCNRLKYELMPLLDEYLQEGRLGPCESELRAYLAWLEGELSLHGTNAQQAN
jgi:5-methylcytosine-specific restriction protein B